MMLSYLRAEACTCYVTMATIWRASAVRTKVP